MVLIQKLTAAGADIRAAKAEADVARIEAQTVKADAEAAKTEAAAAKKAAADLIILRSHVNPPSDTTHDEAEALHCTSQLVGI